MKEKGRSTGSEEARDDLILAARIDSDALGLPVRRDTTHVVVDLRWDKKNHGCVVATRMMGLAQSGPRNQLHHEDQPINMSASDVRTG